MPRTKLAEYLGHLLPSGFRAWLPREKRRAEVRCLLTDTCFRAQILGAGFRLVQRLRRRRRKWRIVTQRNKLWLIFAKLRLHWQYWFCYSNFEWPALKLLYVIFILNLWFALGGTLVCTNINSKSATFSLCTLFYPHFFTCLLLTNVRGPRTSQSAD